MKSGKPQKKALAIAYSMKKKKAKGGMIKNDQSPEVLPGGASSHKNRSGSMSRNDQSPETFYRGGMTDDSREQHGSDCPDCMAQGGMCMSHGGMAQPAGGEPASHRPTKDLYPHRPNHAEGGMVDDMLPLATPRPKRVRDQYQEAGGKPASERATKDQYAEGGQVNAERPLETDPTDDNEEEHPDREGSPMDRVSMGPSSEAMSDLERDPPRESMSLDLVNDIMLDRKRRMAKGGLVSGKVSDYESDSLSSNVGTLKGPIDEPTNSNMDNDKDELDAPYHDGRYQRGLNLEPVHSMEDDEHDVSDASLVAQIMRDRKNRRR